MAKLKRTILLWKLWWLVCAFSACQSTVETGRSVTATDRLAQGSANFLHCELVSAWNYFADWPSTKMTTVWHMPIYYNSHGTMAMIQWEVWACFAAIRCSDLQGLWQSMTPAECFWCQWFQLILDQFGFGSTRPGNNFFTDHHRATARCLPTPGLAAPVQTDRIVNINCILLEAGLWSRNLNFRFRL